MHNDEVLEPLSQPRYWRMVWQHLCDNGPASAVLLSRSLDLGPKPIDNALYDLLQVGLVDRDPPVWSARGDERAFVRGRTQLLAAKRIFSKYGGRRPVNVYRLWRAHWGKLHTLSGATALLLRNLLAPSERDFIARIRPVSAPTLYWTCEHALQCNPAKPMQAQLLDLADERGASDAAVSWLRQQDHILLFWLAARTLGFVVCQSGKLDSYDEAYLTHLYEATPASLKAWLTLDHRKVHSMLRADGGPGLWELPGVMLRRGTWGRKT